MEQIIVWVLGSRAKSFFQQWHWSSVSITNTSFFNVIPFSASPSWIDVMKLIMIFTPKMRAINLHVEKGLVHTLINHDWRLLAAAAVTSMIFITYVVTSLQSFLAMNSAKQHGKRPPTVPYWIPFVGNVISFFWDGPRLAAKVVYVKILLPSIEAVGTWQSACY